MDGLKSRQRYNNDKLRAVLNNFLNIEPSIVTWETVISAMESRNVNNKAIAIKIHQYLSTGKSNKLLLLSNEIISSGVQITTVKCILFSLNQHCSHNVHQVNVIETSN